MVNKTVIMINGKKFSKRNFLNIKSLLCSNYFMSKLSLLIWLTNFLQYDENNIQMKEDFNKFLNIKNQNITLGSKINTYISEKYFILNL